MHGQGIKTLGKGLVHADDGLIEVIHTPELPPFTLGVQMAPEWQTTENPIFLVFGDACRQRVAQRDA